jgi:hypothetical protein
MTDSRRSGLPDFIVIGAAKAATTWVRNQLAMRPDVFLPAPEPHFFSREYHRGEAWYRDWFSDAADGQMIGEKSADYLADPQAAERIYRMIPSARLLVQLRNPIERAYSDYCMLYRRGAVGKRIDDYLGSPSNAMPRFLEDSLYFKHISRFLDWFPEDRIKVILYDDIRRNPEQIVSEVADFLDLPHLTSAVQLAPRANVKDAPLLPLPMRIALRPAKSLVAPMRDQAWFKAVRGMFARTVDYPPLSDDLTKFMRDYFSADVEGMASLVRRDLSHWLGQGDLR